MQMTEIYMFSIIIFLITMHLRMTRDLGGMGLNPAHYLSYFVIFVLWLTFGTDKLTSAKRKIRGWFWGLWSIKEGRMWQSGWFEYQGQIAQVVEHLRLEIQGQLFKLQSVLSLFLPFPPLELTV